MCNVTSYLTLHKGRRKDRSSMVAENLCPYISVAGGKSEAAS